MSQISSFTTSTLLVMDVGAGSSIMITGMACTVVKRFDSELCPTFPLLSLHSADAVGCWGAVTESTTFDGVPRLTSTCITVCILCHLGSGSFAVEFF